MVAQKLQYLYPNSLPLVDWRVQDNGAGAFIAYWNPALGAQPTQAQLDAITEAELVSTFNAREDAKEPLLADLKAQAQAAIDANVTYLAIASPSNAQVAAQVRALTQQQQRVIKALNRTLQRVWR